MPSEFVDDLNRRDPYDNTGPGFPTHPLVRNYNTNQISGIRIGSHLFSDTGLRNDLMVVRNGERTLPLQMSQAWQGGAVIVPGATTVPLTLGCTLATAGTISHPTVASTNILTSSRRIQSLAAAGANQSATIRTAQALCWRGNGAGLGGFYWCWRGVMSFDTTGIPDSHTGFCGLYGTVGSIGNTVPSNLVDMVGFGADATDGNMQFMVNDGSGTATKTDLSSSFACGLSQSVVWQFEIYCPPNASVIYWRATRLDDASLALVSGVATSNLPTSTVFLAPNVHANSQADAIDAVSIATLRMTLETPL